MSPRPAASASLSGRTPGAVGVVEVATGGDDGEDSGQRAVPGVVEGASAVHRHGPRVRAAPQQSRGHPTVRIVADHDQRRGVVAVAQVDGRAGPEQRVDHPPRSGAGHEVEGARADTVGLVRVDARQQQGGQQPHLVGGRRVEE